MPRWSLIVASSFFALLAVVSTGCDSVEFVPSPPAELRETGADSVRAATPASIDNPHTNGVELIVKRRASIEDLEAVLTSVRTQAGYDKVRLKVAVAEDSVAKKDGAASAPSAQAELLRKVIARRPQALVIEIEDPQDAATGAALMDARAAGIIVVVSGVAPATQTAPASSQKLAPMIVVAPRSFAASATDLVTSALRNAKNAGIADRKSAVILEANFADTLADKRMAAIATALKAAGVTDVQEVHVSHETDKAQKKLSELLEANSKIGLVFAVDATTATAVVQTLDALIPARPFVASAYTFESNQVKSVSFGQFAAIGDYNPLRVLRKAITVAATAMQHGETPETVDIGIATQDSPSSSKLSQSPTILAKNSPTLAPK